MGNLLKMNNNKIMFMATHHAVRPNTGVGARQRREAAQERDTMRRQPGHSSFNYALFRALLPSLLKEASNEGRELAPEEVASLMRSCGGCEPWITRQPNGEITVENDDVRCRFCAGTTGADLERWHRTRRHSHTAEEDHGDGLVVQSSW